jgi:hypothetical protein
MTLTHIKDQTIGLIEVKQRDGDYISTTVMKKGTKLITGTPTNSMFLCNEWEVDLENYYSLDEALDDLYSAISASAKSKPVNKFR